MNVLVTGGAGFIGSHLAEEILARNHNVIVIDNLSTGSIENIEHLKTNDRFTYYIDTIMNRPLMAELIDKCDEIYHLAAAVGVRLIIDRPVETIETNIKGTEIVLEFANKKKKKVLIASSSEVYGKNNNVPFNEEDDLVLGSTMRSRWSYACSKAIDEFLAFAYWRENTLPVVIGRFFNTVGPRQIGQYGMVIPRFVTQALKGEPITVYGDGTQTRSFTYVGDVVNACIKLMETPGALGKVFNIGSNSEVSIDTLARIVKERSKSNSEIIHVPFNEAYDDNFEDMQRRVPDISKINRLIGYEPTKTIEQIIDSVIEYHKSIG